MKEFTHFLKHFYQFTGKILYFNLLGMVIVSLLDGAAILLLIPMLSIGGILEMQSQNAGFWGILNFLKEIPKGTGLTTILGIYLVMVIGQSLLERNLAIRDVKIQQGFVNHLKEDTYNGLLNVRWEFYLKTRKSNLINSLTKDINRVAMGIKMFMLLATNLIFTLIQIGIAFWISFQISSLVLLCGLCLAFFSWRFVKQAKSLGKESTQLARRYLAGITDNLNGIKDIKTNTLEKSRLNWMKSLNKRMLTEQVNYVKLQSNSQVSYKTALGAIITSFIFFSVHFFSAQPAKLLMVILLFSRLWPRFVGIQSYLQQLAMTIPAFKVLLDLHNETNVNKDIEFGSNINEPLEIKESIECKNVFFTYSDVAKPTLHNINLRIPVKQMTAIVGDSGAGKSTLVDLLLGLHQPESGEILVDETAITKEKLYAYKNSISFVPQDPFLFNATILENLLLMKPDAKKEQVWNALKLAAADQFVKRLPRGIHTRVGDRGINLSGGERQRLVLARALLRNPSVLILDEATSALDTENETKILEALERIKGTMTIIIIAHRSLSIQKADQVIELSEGKIVERRIDKVLMDT
ncbi:ABC transporter ATP-binding protein [Neobacillus sp. D3-1R]|uniref:ABC transporter ATP-binding protein n=1 Tax=Neobacillus sp. D3-1R TaxID=3445778 RepID=UPI003FA111CE